MMPRQLNALQVAALLVSASYGIGFLFGSGELALRLGMAGSIYAIATAIGMVLLALAARKLWKFDAPIWDMFGQAYGAELKNSVAMLSLIWMTGVLAAQIQGSVAILKMVGLPPSTCYGLSLLLLLGACSLNLRLASKLFSVCLVASNLALLYAIAKADGLQVYLESVPRFIQDMQRAQPFELSVTFVAVLFLVVTGSDYQQFVIAARRPIDALIGCVLAACFLLLTGFLPAAAVVAAQHTGMFDNLTDAKQVVPLLLTKMTGTAGAFISGSFLLVLLSAALGSGAAITRAMTSALESTLSGLLHGKLNVSSRICMLMVAIVGMLTAARGQAIIDTMVSVNIVYIASIAVLFVSQQCGVRLAPRTAKWAMGSGFFVAMAFNVLGWSGVLIHHADLLSLCFGLLASALAVFAGRINRMALG